MQRNKLLTWGDGPSGGATALRVAVALAAVLLGLVALLGADQQPPRPLDHDAPVDQFSAARAMDVLEEIAAAPHAVGQSNHGKVRDRLIEILLSHGLEVEIHAATIEGRPTVYNLIVEVPGTLGVAGDTILAAAHYDSVIDAPGAADDGVGTVALVEAARALVAGQPLANNVVFLITDGEEQGLWGAEAWIAEYARSVETDLVLNFESGGPRGPLTLVEADRSTPAMIRTLVDVAPAPVTTSLMNDLVAAARDAGIASTDFVPFRELGQPGYNFANSKDTSFRHSPGDEFWRIDPATVQHQGQTALALIREYGDRDLRAVGGDGETVWIVVFSWLTLAWTYGTAWLLLFLVTAGTIALIVALRRRDEVRVGAVLRVTGSVFGAMLASMVAATMTIGLILLVRADHRPHFNGLQPRTEFPGSGVPGEELYWFGAMGIAAAAAVVVLLRTRSKVTVHEMALGTTVVFLALAILSTWGLTGASFLFVLPLLFLLPAHALWLVATNAEIGTWRAFGVVALGAVPTVLVGGNVVVFFETFTAPNAAIIAPITALYVAALVPALELIARGDRRLPLLGTAGLGAGLLLAGLLTVSASPITETHEYLGALADVEVTREAIDLDEVPDAGLWNLTFEDGRHCVEAPAAREPFVWCPLPSTVAIPVDVQLVRLGGDVLLMGSVSREGTVVQFQHGGDTLELETFEVMGIPGRFFAGKVPANVGRIDAVMVLDQADKQIAARHGFVLPDADTVLRGP